MRTVLAVAFMVTLGATRAGAVDIQGKWGIGAGVFAGGGEASLIKGKSDRSAWLLNVSASFKEVSRSRSSPVPSVLNASTLFVTAGPGYRRYLRRADAFSPYWDASLRGLYHRQRFGGGGTSTYQDIGAEAGFAFGLEYFTPWQFSIAGHTGVASLEWLHRTRNTQDPFGGRTHVSGHLERVSFQLSPSLFLRTYF